MVYGVQAGILSITRESSDEIYAYIQLEWHWSYDQIGRLLAERNVLNVDLFLACKEFRSRYSIS